MKHSILNFGKAALLTPLLLLLATDTKATSYVNSGNNAGESQLIPAWLLAVNLPDSCYNLTATRLDLNRVRLNWVGAFPSGSTNYHKYVIFRAADEGPWEVLGTSLATNFTDLNASLTADLRYKVAIKATFYPTLPNPSDKTGPPTNEVTERWADVGIRIGASDIVAPGTNYPQGMLMVSKFLPVLFDEGPQDYAIYGPFQTVTALPPESPSMWYMEGVFPQGFMRRGVLNFAGGNVQTTGMYRSPYLNIVPAGDWDWSGLVPLPTYTYEGEDRTLTLSGSQFIIYSGNVNGLDLQGFDGTSNPVSQMLPLGPSATPRTLAFNVGPKLGDQERGFSVVPMTGENVPDPDVTVNPDVKLLGGSSHEYTVTGSERVSSLPIAMTRNKMYFDITKKRTLTVGVYYLDLVAYNGGVIEPVYPPYKKLVTADVENALNDTYGKQANLFFSVQNNAVMEMIRWRMGVTSDMSVIDDKFRVDGICDIINEGQIFLSKANADSYHLSLFVVPKNKKVGISLVGNSVLPPETGLYGVVPSIPANRCFIVQDSPISTICHEIGHALGLHHSFEINTGYSSSEIPDDPRTRIMGYDRTNFRILRQERETVRTQAKELLGEPN